LCAGTPRGVFAAPKVSPDAATLQRVKMAMQALGGRFRDMESQADIIVTPPKGSGDQKQSRQMAITAHLLLKMPDKVKFQVLNSTFPIFNRWIFVQKGNNFLAYDPVSDRYIATDFRQLTGRDLARVDTKMAFMGLLFNPARYRFSMQGKVVRKSIPVYRVRMTLLKPEQLNPLTYLSYTDMYVDMVHLAPVHSESYDTKGRLATTGEFRNPVLTPAGWAPTRITITDHQFERLKALHKGTAEREAMRKKLAQELGKPLPVRPAEPYRNGTLDLWIGWSGKVLYPWKMLAQPPEGGITQWTFTRTKVNTGLKDSDFELRGK
jgi:hypothetical protein